MRRFFFLLILKFALLTFIQGCQPFCPLCDPTGSCDLCQLPLVYKNFNGEQICWAPSCELGTFYSNNTKNCQLSCQQGEYPNRAYQTCVSIETCPMKISDGGSFHENGILQSLMNDEQDIIVSIGVNDTKIIFNSISKRDTLQILDLHHQPLIRIAIDETSDELYGISSRGQLVIWSF